MTGKLVIKNRQEVLADRVIVADTFFSRFLGLMGRTSFTNRDALWLIPCNQVHTMFMFFYLDLLFLDKGNRVLRKVENIRPFAFSPRESRARSVVELKGGALSYISVYEGDQLIFVPPGS